MEVRLSINMNVKICFIFLFLSVRSNQKNIRENNKTAIGNIYSNFSNTLMTLGCSTMNKFYRNFNRIEKCLQWLSGDIIVQHIYENIKINIYISIQRMWCWCHCRLLLLLLWFLFVIMVSVIAYSFFLYFLPKAFSFNHKFHDLF